MTITELKTLIDAALERGINPDTTVVIDVSDQSTSIDYEWAVLTAAEDPTKDDPTLLWFTLVPGGPADYLVHTAHEADYDF